MKKPLVLGTTAGLAFSVQILQLPEYLNDYTYHGYTSPALYLLQLLSWAVSVLGLIVVAGAAGWGLRRFA